MEGIIQHRQFTINGLSVHIAEAGHGPTILFLHGFPECWYTWRHQLIFFSRHGYHVVAPDLRGYADTTGAPSSDPSKFTTMHVVGDLVALIDAVAPPTEKIFVVAHDWGAIEAWALCLYRPDKVKALVNMSVPFTPRNPDRKPVPTLRAVFGDDYYVVRFQEPGVIEKEFAEFGTKNVIKHFLTYRNPGPLYLPKENIFPDVEITLPDWLSEEDIDFYAEKFDAAGFTGGLNYYRALDLNWELTAPWTGAQMKVPTKFIVGDLDLTYNSVGVKDYINKGGFKRDVPLLKEVAVLEGVGHFIHEEKPDEVNTHILSFLKNSSSSNWCLPL